MQSKHPTSAMVFGAAVNNGKLLPLNFIEASLKVTTAEYLKILQIYLTPRIKKNYDPMKVICSQRTQQLFVAQKQCRP